MTNGEIHRFLASRDLRALRKACGIRTETVAAATGVTRQVVAHWEARRRVPHGVVGERYVRVVTGMERHLEVTRDDESEAAA